MIDPKKRKEPSMDDDQYQTISKRAYELWEAEGRPHGRDREHWEQVEQEVLSQQQQQAASPADDADLSLPQEQSETMAAASSPASTALPAKKASAAGRAKKAKTP
ncbi:hypothetical protein M2336_001105 [Sphingobium sp. B1D7B]|uniref:DUF2934 domain-containing protein n=1 Tax=unclassified Sphingobium TaxID=2611147 RepID=UPI002224F380|nr:MULTISPECIES: DUF2934 domain-containing protein [unclassified Sphingobium]MCW2392742.1 hypothetical protein [Sphingobium sp. B11D3A]MCW2404476.1 hypothetical protein [Sphingobium sp. B1D7B]